MSVSVERERDDGLMSDDIELNELEDRIESAAATRAPLRRLLLPLLLPVEKRPAARRRPVLASIVVRSRKEKRRRGRVSLSPRKGEFFSFFPFFGRGKSENRLDSLHKREPVEGQSPSFESTLPVSCCFPFLSIVRAQR